MALVITIVAMVFLVAVGYPALAILAGLLGVLFIGASGERYREFGEVEVPAAGDYPKWEFWKEAISDTGTFLGKLSKTFLRTEQPIDAWSSWLKKKVYGGESAYWFMYGPFGMNVSKDFMKAVEKASIFNVYAKQLEHLREIGAISEEEYQRLMKELAKTLQEYAKK